MGKPRWGSYHGLFQIKLGLITFGFLLLTDVSPYGFLIQSNTTDAVSSGPKMHPSNPFVPQNMPVDNHRAFAFEKPNHERNTELRGNPQAHVYMVGHQMPFHQLYTSLPTQVPKYIADPFASLTV
jgi:hypothetical protein